MVGYMTAVWRCRYFWLSLVKMDLRTRYRRSVLGLGWSLLQPLAMTIILCIVFHRLFNADIPTYAPHLMAGMAFWNYLVSVTLQGCQCFYQAEAYIRQFPSPLAIFPLRTALGGTFHFLVAISVTICMTALVKGLSNPIALLSLIPAVLLLGIFVWSMALLAGFATVLFHDTQHLAEVGFQMLFYATPIIYFDEIFKQHDLVWLMRFNPLVPFLNLIRMPIVKGQLPDVTTYASACCFTLLAASFACLLLSRMQRKLIFYL